MGRERRGHRGGREDSAPTGIEDWFDAPTEVVVADAPLPAPPRWKQMVSILIVFSPLSLPIPLVGAPFTGSLPLWLRALITVAVATPLMTSLQLPLVTRALRPGLLRGPVRSRAG